MPSINVVLVVGGLEKVVFGQDLVIGKDIFTVSWMVADAQILVPRHQVYVEPFRKGHASRGSVDIGIVDGNVVFFAVNFVNIGGVLRLDVAELYIGANGASVFLFEMLIVITCRHGGIHGRGVCHGKTGGQ